MDEATARDTICDIGRRLYARGFASGNGGNISCRIAPDRVLCTPNGVSKGFMHPDDLCTVGLDGTRATGRRRPTSEIHMHLAVLRVRHDVAAVVHCHPPHAAAFAITGCEIPSGVLPEVEYHLGDVPTAPALVPGSAELADAVGQLAQHANTVVLANHGTISWGPSVEDAYWKAEILDAYCQMLILARAVGPVRRLSPSHIAEVAAMRRRDAEPSQDRSQED